MIRLAPHTIVNASGIEDFTLYYEADKMFVYMRYTHPDVAYHSIEGPFDTPELARTHAMSEINEPESPTEDLVWTDDGMHAHNDFEQCVYIHELKG